MQYPPKKWTPGTWSIFNGRPTYANDIGSLDRWTAWLASVYRQHLPYVVGAPMDSTVVHTLTLDAPQYRGGLAFRALVCGRGSLSLTCSDDFWTIDSGTIGVGDGVTHSLAAAQWAVADQQLTGVGAHNLWRAFDLTNQSSPHTITVEMTITDAGGGASLVVYGLYFEWLPPSDTDGLPA